MCGLCSLLLKNKNKNETSHFFSRSLVRRGTWFFVVCFLTPLWNCSLYYKSVSRRSTNREEKESWLGQGILGPQEWYRIKDHSPSVSQIHPQNWSAEVRWAGFPAPGSAASSAREPPAKEVETSALAGFGREGQWWHLVLNECVWPEWTLT